jgi:peroxiredoxin
VSATPRDLPVAPGRRRGLRQTQIQGLSDRDDEGELALRSSNLGDVDMEIADATGSKGHINFLADGAGDFAKALGLDFDASMGGLGVRSKRYAMLVEDGVVKELNIEPKPIEADVSSATHLLEQMK